MSKKYPSTSIGLFKHLPSNWPAIAAQLVEWLLLTLKRSMKQDQSDQMARLFI